MYTKFKKSISLTLKCDIDLESALLSHEVCTLSHCEDHFSEVK